jgi:hypothetical protein
MNVANPVQRKGTNISEEKERKKMSSILWCIRKIMIKELKKGLDSRFHLGEVW